MYPAKSGIFILCSIREKNMSIPTLRFWFCFLFHIPYWGWCWWIYETACKIGYLQLCILKVTILMVTFNILRLNGPLRIWVSQNIGKHPAKNPKTYPPLGARIKKRRARKPSRRRAEAAYSVNKIRQNSGTARGVNLNLQKGQRGQELREDY